MGSSDSSCCGASHSAPKPETDSALLKQNRSRANQLHSTHPASSKQEGRPHAVSANSIESTITEYCNFGAKQLDLEPVSSVSPQPTPQPASSEEGGAAPFGQHLVTPRPHRNGATPKKRKRKKRYNRVRTQLQILCSENSRAQSLLLCSKPEKINCDGVVKGFGFLKYLETNLSHNAVSELFSKLPARTKSKESADEQEQTANETDSEDENVVSETQFVSLLMLIVIIYRIKLHKLRTGTQEKPAVNSEKIKSCIEHLAVWIMRTYGEKQNVRKKVTVYDDAENKIEGDFYVYKWRVNQKEFEENIYKWVDAYVEQEGQYVLTQII